MFCDQSFCASARRLHTKLSVASGGRYPRPPIGILPISVGRPELLSCRRVSLVVRGLLQLPLPRAPRASTPRPRKLRAGWRAHATRGGPEPTRCYPHAALLSVSQEVDIEARRRTQLTRTQGAARIRPSEGKPHGGRRGICRGGDFVLTQRNGSGLRSSSPST